jgi:hypothetical protein
MQARQGRVARLKGRRGGRFRLRQFTPLVLTNEQGFVGHVRRLPRCIEGASGARADVSGIHSRADGYDVDGSYAVLRD